MWSLRWVFRKWTFAALKWNAKSSADQGRQQELLWQTTRYWDNASQQSVVLLISLSLKSWGAEIAEECSQWTQWCRFYRGHKTDPLEDSVPHILASDYTASKHNAQSGLYLNYFCTRRILSLSPNCWMPECCWDNFTNSLYPGKEWLHSYDFSWPFPALNPITLDISGETRPLCSYSSGVTTNVSSKTISL